MRYRLSSKTLVVLAVFALAGAVGVASYAQRSAARTGMAATQTAQTLLTAMLDQETGLRGRTISNDESFLEPYRIGRANYPRAFARARRLTAGDEAARAALERSDAAAQAWVQLADLEIALLRSTVRREARYRERMRTRKLHMDSFRGHNKRYAAIVAARSRQLETRALYVAVLTVVVLGLLFSVAGLLITRHNRRFNARRRAREQAFEARQRDLTLTLQVTESEPEAHEFLRRHLEQSVASSEVVVLTRNNSSNRLLPGTDLAEGSRLTGELEELEPKQCLAVRLAQRRDHDATQSNSILQCGICGKLETRTTCSPLLVGGEVIGSVLVGHAEPLDDHGERAIDESVKQAAPVLANLRNLAIAETRAATDGLTGLPNRRAFEEALKRMTAQANRAEGTLAAVALDLDRFKQINDVHGHGRGDEVLAAVGALLRSTLRDSDFVARIGGEEFMLLLPETGRDGALVICERIRVAVEALSFTGMAEPVTASMGVAVLPDDGVEGPALVRAADRMLYAAKSNGRNRVEITDLVLGPVPDGAAQG